MVQGKEMQKLYWSAQGKYPHCFMQETTPGTR